MVENKSLIVICRDAVGVFGYTGCAYVEGQPTDQWIAAQLIRKRDEPPWLGGYMFSSVGIGDLTLNTVFWRLAEALRAARLPSRANYLAIMAAGYWKRRSRVNLFVKEVVRDRNGIHFTSSMRGPRTRRGHAFLAQIGDEFPDNEPWHYVDERVRALGANVPDCFPSALADTVRLRASQTQSVGPDVMTVLIPRAYPPVITWQFHPSRPHEATLVGGAHAIPVKAVYSPWVLAPSLVACPTIATLGFQVKAGKWQVRSGDMNGPNNGTGLHYVGPQLRK